MVICCCPGRRLLAFVDDGHIAGLLKVAVVDVVVAVAVVDAVVVVVVDRLVGGMNNCWRVEQGELLLRWRMVEEGWGEE